MKRKSMIALGVASTLGMGAAVFAASTPFPASVDDSTPWTAHLQRQDTMLTPNHIGWSSGVGVTSSSASGEVSGSSTFDHSMTLSQESSSFSNEHFSGLTMEESLALADEGIYSNFHLASASPMTIHEQWDYYTLEPVYDLSAEQFVYVPSYVGSEYIVSFDENVESAM